MKLRMNNKRLEELQNMLNEKMTEKVPKGWNSSEYIIKMTGKGRATISTMLSNFVKNGVIPPPKTFKVNKNGRVIGVPHYKLDL